MYLEKLTGIIPPPANPTHCGNSNERNLFEERTGLFLPDDYYELLHRYGAGYFCNSDKENETFYNCIAIYNPFSFDSWLNMDKALKREREFYIDFQREERIDAERMRNMARENPYLKLNPVNLIYIYPFFPDKNGLIPLGDMGELECKLYLKPNESDIGYSVLAERFPKFYEYNVTVTQFLYELLTGQIPQIDMGDMFNEKIVFYSVS